MTIPRLSLSRFWPWVVCGIVSLIILRVYFHAGVPLTHDGENHLARFANYKVALKEGQWPPRFAPNLVHHYGYPVFNYNYPLPSILSVPFSLVKTSYQLTFKVLMSLAVIAVLTGIWKWLSMLGINRLGRLLAVISVTVSPYFLQTVIYRGSIGEVIALSCISWWLVWVEYLRKLPLPYKKQSWKTLLTNHQTVVGGVLLALFFLSHNVTVLFGTPLLLAYSLWRLWQRRELLVHVVGAMLIGLGLSLWFWLPALMEQSAVIVGGSSLAQQYLRHFPTLNELMSSPLQFGFSYVGPVDSLSFGLGWAQWAAVLCGVGWVLSALFHRSKESLKKIDPVLSVMLGMNVLFLLFQLSITSGVWQLVPFARFIQFPWRLGLYTTVTTAVLIGWIVQQRIRWQVCFVAFLLVAQVVVALRVTPVGYVNKPNIEFELFEQSTTTSNENLPRNFTHQDFADWRPTPILLSGEAEITIQKWTGSSRTYTVNAHVPTVVVEPTMYFPGWITTVSNGSSEQQVTYLEDKVVGGRIGYQLEPGNYQVKSRFTQWTWPRVVGNTVSGLSAVVIGSYLIGWMWSRRSKKSV